MARILCVEDDEDLQKLLGRALFRAGHEVHYAWNGEEGWKMLLSCDPDLVLLDLMMPLLDGVGFLERLRAAPALRAVPVIVVTAFGDEAEMLRRAVTALGAACYLRKPVDLKELEVRVREVLAAAPPSGGDAPGARLLSKGAVRADPLRGIAWVDDRPVGPLRRKEFTALALLLGAEGPLSKAQLMAGLGYDLRQDAALKQTVHRLRLALGAAGRDIVRTTRDGYELAG